MLERELTALRQQLAAGAYYANRTATLGGVLSKMGGSLGAPPSLGGSARQDTARKSSLESPHQNTNAKAHGRFLNAGSSTHAETQREAVDERIHHQAALELPMASAHANTHAPAGAPW